MTQGGPREQPWPGYPIGLHAEDKAFRPVFRQVQHIIKHPPRRDESAPWLTLVRLLRELRESAALRESLQELSELEDQLAIHNARLNRAAMPAMLANVLEEVIGEEKLSRKGWLDLAAQVTERLDVWPRELADPALLGGRSVPAEPTPHGVLRDDDKLRLIEMHDWYSRPHSPDSPCIKYVEEIRFLLSLLVDRGAPPQGGPPTP